MGEMASASLIPTDEILLDAAQRLGTALRAANKTLATAESCTGGGLGWHLTAISGSSDWYLGGVISYSNQLKIDLLGVSASALADFGAVSEAVAAEMAQGVRRQTASHFGVAVTGIAGPLGGTQDKPVGTVCFGWASAEGCVVEKCQFNGGRDAVRRRSILHAMDGLTQLIDKSWSNQ